jgi:hypothetical protein
MFGWKQPQADLPEITQADLPEITVEELTPPKSPVTTESDVKPTEAVVVKPAEWQTPTFRHVDRPDCAETFADSITGVFFDGQTLRIEFSVSRMDETKPGAPLTGHRTPVCRLVVPPSTALDLVQKMQQVGAALAKAGYVRNAGPPAKAS